MKKLFVPLLLLFSLAASAQFSIIKAPTYTHSLDSGFVAVSKDSAGYARLYHLPVSALGGAGTAGVSAFNGRTGSVTPQASDYSSFYIVTQRFLDSLTAHRTTIDSKVDKIAGKGLSTNDYTTAEKASVATIAGKQSNLNIINAKDYGATGDGTTNDAAALQALIAPNTNVFLPKGIYHISTALNFSGITNFKLFGEPGTVIQMTAASGATYPYALVTISGAISNIQLSNIKLENTTIQATEQAGLININSLSSTLNLNGIEIDHCEFSCPNLNANAVTLNTVDAARAKNIKFNDNLIDSVGRMGFEFVSRAPGGSTSDDIVRYSNIEMLRNTVNYTGLSGTFGCGFSLSGTCENVNISGNLFYELGKNHAVELVGAHRAVVDGNRMIGITKTFNAISCNNDAGLQFNSDIVFSNNTSLLYDSTKAGNAAMGWSFLNTKNSSIIGNTINTDGNCLLDNCRNITISGNSVFGKAYTALLVQNGTTGTFASGNTFDNSAAASSSGTIRCEGATTTGNVFSNNIMTPPTGDGNVAFNQLSGATGNAFIRAGTSQRSPVRFVTTQDFFQFDLYDEVVFFGTGVTRFSLPSPLAIRNGTNRGLTIKNTTTGTITISNTTYLGAGEPTSIPAGGAITFKAYNELWYAVSKY